MKLRILNLNRNSLRSLVGLERCVNLTELHVCGNQLAFKKPSGADSQKQKKRAIHEMSRFAAPEANYLAVSCLKQLEYLDLSENEVNHIENVPPLSSLSVFFIGSNPFSTVNVSVLRSAYPNLTLFDVSAAGLEIVTKKEKADKTAGDQQWTLTEVVLRDTKISTDETKTKEAETVFRAEAPLLEVWDAQEQPSLEPKLELESLMETRARPSSSLDDLDPRAEPKFANETLMQGIRDLRAQLSEGLRKTQRKFDQKIEDLALERRRKSFSHPPRSRKEDKR